MSFNLRSSVSVFVTLAVAVVLSACAEVSVPDARNVKIPSPATANERKEAINERPDSVMYLPLGADVLVPTRISGEGLPNENVGPFELRSETLAGALQLILADYDVSIAFETEEGLTRKVTVANLKGRLDKVVSRVCSLADLYCSYEDGTIIVKDTQTFTVTLPPLAGAEGGEEFITDVIQGLGAVLGGEGTPVSDPTTRTIIYSATQRTSKLAENYFQRLRANTAMIVFETYIWEVSLDAGNSTGIQWDKIEAFGKFNASIDLSGTTAANFTNPVAIGLPTTQALGATPTQLVRFLSQFGAVKTISQPQITVLSGSEAELRVADTENYVSEVSSTVSGDNTTTSVSTDSVDSGFTLTIDSSWDKSTVYSNVNINLTNVVTIDDFAFDTDGGGGQTTIQLPQTTERELTTQIRVRPGDSVLIAGLVRETDNFNSRGLGFMEPVIPDSRTGETENLELVILLRPRVIVYTSEEGASYQNTVKKPEPNVVSPKVREEWLKSNRRSRLDNPVNPVVNDAVTPYVSTQPQKNVIVEDEPVVEEAYISPVEPIEESNAPVQLTQPIEEAVIEEDPVVEETYFPSVESIEEPVIEEVLLPVAKPNVMPASTQVEEIIKKESVSESGSKISPYVSIEAEKPIISPRAPYVSKSPGVVPLADVVDPPVEEVVWPAPANDELEAAQESNVYEAIEESAKPVLESGSAVLLDNGLNDESDGASSERNIYEEFEKSKNAF